MPKKNTVKGSRKVSKKSSDKSKKNSNKPRKNSKKNSKSKSSRKYKSVSSISSTEELRQLLESSDDNNDVTQHQGMPQQYQGMPQQGPQMLSPSQVDPMLINNSIPYQQPNNFMGMNSQNLLSANQMVQGLKNFSNTPAYNNNILSPTNGPLSGTQNVNQMPDMNQMSNMNQMPMMNQMPDMNQMPNMISNLKNFL